jgi:hypothetical protein
MPHPLLLNVLRDGSKMRDSNADLVLLPAEDDTGRRSLPIAARTILHIGYLKPVTLSQRGGV